MNQTPVKDTKVEIIQSFAKLLGEYQKSDSKVSTKEEAAEKAKNQELLNTVADYTINNIVNSLASLQLDFGNIINELSERLTNQSSKLEELQRAIAVETENLEQIKKIRLAADALDILTQEHQEKLKNLENRINEQKEALEKEQESTRKAWEKEAEEFTTRITEEQELLQQTREQEKADLLYSIERQRKIETDEYNETKRNQERELRETKQSKEKGWSEREKYLADNQADFAAKEKEVQGFEEALNKAYNDAKGEAIKDAERDIKVKTDLQEKEWESLKQGYELKIKSLENMLEKQIEEIAELNTQLQATNNQAQNLALRAFQSPANTN